MTRQKLKIKSVLGKFFIFKNANKKIVIFLLHERKYLNQHLTTITSVVKPKIDSNIKS